MTSGLLDVVLVPILTSGNIFGSVAALRLVVVDRTVAATLFSRGNSAQAYVELLTILGMSVFRMIDLSSSGVDLTVLRALETVFQDFADNSASLTASAVGPHAGAAVLVEVKTGRARDFDGLTVDAVVENIANRGIRMSEESVAPRAFLRRLGRLQFQSVAAVHVEYVVALVDLAIQRIEDQAIGTKLFRRDTVGALIIFVALNRIIVLSVFVRTIVRGMRKRS